jgi:hypothetical protein
MKIILQNKTEFTIKNLKENPEYWEKQVPEFFLLREKILGGRLDSMDRLNVATTRLNESIVAVAINLQSIREIGEYYNKRIEEFNNWDANNSADLYELYFMRMTAGIKEAGLKKEVIPLLVFEILLDVQINNVNLKPGEKIPFEIWELFIERWGYFSRNNFTCHGYMKICDSDQRVPKFMIDNFRARKRKSLQRYLSKKHIPIR